MDFNKWLSIFTIAGVIGLLVLNPQGASAVFSAGSGAVNSYISTVQGRG